ncbi:MAG: S41 family peptidase [Acidimicrobiia bacterium]
MSRRLTVAGAVVGVLFIACNPGAREAEPFQGNWQSEAWGTYLSVNGGSIEIFEFSAVHCFSVASGGARGVGEVLSMEGEALILADAGRTVRFERTRFLPEECIAPVADDPLTTFQVLAATFEEHYLPGVDAAWAERVEASRPPVDASNDSLFDALTLLLAPLDRADVRLSADGEVWAAARASPIDFPQVESLGRGGILTGSFGDGIAYVAFRRLGEFADDTDGSQRAAADAIDAAVASGDSVVLDLRGSDGGAIDHAMLIASRFLPAEGLIARLAARGAGGFVPAGEVTVRPLPTGTFGGTTAVLVGPGTIGVAELLAAALQGADGVTIVGRRTAGSAGPAMVRFLPNGWSVGLPNLEVTLSDGTDLADGVQPDVLAEDALATALEILGE